MTLYLFLTVQGFFPLFILLKFERFPHSTVIVGYFYAVFHLRAVDQVIVMK